MEKGKKENVWIVLIIVLVLVVLGFWSMSKNSAPVYDQTMDSVEDTGGATGAPAASISYQNALVKYKDARIQLDKICQASPDKMTFKNGTNIMVDNRAPVARTVKVGSVFTLKAYSYKIVNLSSETLPATWYVDCDKSQNVATILIQK